jgi:hypothetical protein
MLRAPLARGPGAMRQESNHDRRMLLLASENCLRIARSRMPMKRRSKSIAPAWARVVRLREICTRTVPSNDASSSARRRSRETRTLTPFPAPSATASSWRYFAKRPVAVFNERSSASATRCVICSPAVATILRPTEGCSCATRFTASMPSRCSRVSVIALALTMCIPVVNADAMQNISPGYSNTFRICSRPSAFMRKNFTRPDSRMQRLLHGSPSIKPVGRLERLSAGSERRWFPAPLDQGRQTVGTPP